MPAVSECCIKYKIVRFRKVADVGKDPRKALLRRYNRVQKQTCECSKESQ